jgi:hypothetical protein
MTKRTTEQAREAFREAADGVVGQEPIDVIGLTFEEIQQELTTIAGEEISVDEAACFAEGMLVGIAFQS